MRHKTVKYLNISDWIVNELLLNAPKGDDYNVLHDTNSFVYLRIHYFWLKLSMHASTIVQVGI